MYGVHTVAGQVVLSDDTLTDPSTGVASAKGIFSTSSSLLRNHLGHLSLFELDETSKACLSTASSF
jgi:hypothetical protein